MACRCFWSVSPIWWNLDLLFPCVLFTCKCCLFNVVPTNLTTVKIPCCYMCVEAFAAKKFIEIFLYRQLCQVVKILHLRDRVGPWCVGEFLHVDTAVCSRRFYWIPCCCHIPLFIVFSPVVLSETRYRHVSIHISPHLFQWHILGSDANILHTYIIVLVRVVWKFADLNFMLCYLHVASHVPLPFFSIPISRCIANVLCKLCHIYCRILLWIHLGKKSHIYIHFNISCSFLVCNSDIHWGLPVVDPLKRTHCFKTPVIF